MSAALSGGGVVHRRAAAWDAALYGGAAIAALAIALLASIPLQREWGRMALLPYAAGAGAAMALAVRGAGVRVRAWLAVAVLFGAALLPLVVEVTWRARQGPGSHAQSEAIVTEEAARALVAGRNPYAATYLHGPLAARPLGTKTHFPYLPAMLTFGLPRAVDGASPLADARVAFAVATLAVTALALRLWMTSPEGRLRAFQVMAVLPTGALPMATGGDDLPVLALMLLSLVLVQRGEPAGAGLAAGLAAGMKQTAWLLVPFMVVAARDTHGRNARAGLAAIAAAVAGALIGPFLVWGAGHFVEDVVLFPLGLGQQATPAGTTTIGGLLIRAVPSAKGPMSVVLVVMVLAAAAYLLVRRPPGTAAGAAGLAGLVVSLALILAPAARLGYVIYPINFLGWARLLSDRGQDKTAEVSVRAIRDGP